MSEPRLLKKNGHCSRKNLNAYTTYTLGQTLNNHIVSVMLIAQEQDHSSISLLAEVSRTITNEDDINKVLRLVLFIMSEHMNMLRGMITILNRDSGEIVINESFGLTEKEKERGRYQIGEGIIGHVVKTGKTVVVPSINDEPLFLDRTRSRAKAKKEGLCFICIPIKAGTEIIGTLSADRQLEHVPSKENVKNSKSRRSTAWICCSTMSTSSRS